MRAVALAAAAGALLGAAEADDGAAADGPGPGAAEPFGVRRCAAISRSLMVRAMYMDGGMRLSRIRPVKASSTRTLKSKDTNMDRLVD